MIEILLPILAIGCIGLLVIVFSQYKIIIQQKSDLLQEKAERVIEVAEARKQPSMTMDAADLMNDLTTRGRSLVMVTPINASDFYLRRPN